MSIVIDHPVELNAKSSVIHRFPSIKLSGWSVDGLALAATLAIAELDWATAAELSLSPLYLAPIFFVTWTRPEWHGLAFVVLATLLNVVVDIVEPVKYSHPFFLFWSGATRFVFFATATTLIARLRHAHVRLEQAARVDSLTGLLNRRGFAEEAERERARAERYRRPLSLAFIDLDHFKLVNDSLGHAAGDAVLREVGEELSAFACRTSPFV